MRTVEIIYGLTGQTVECYPPDWREGVPSSATVEVFPGEVGNDDTTNDGYFTAAATVDSTSVTSNAASGYSQTNRNHFFLGPTSGTVIGRQYLTENNLQQRELAVPKGIASNSHLVLENDLAFDYPSGSSTIKGYRMVFTVDAAWVATEARITGPWA